MTEPTRTPGLDATLTSRYECKYLIDQRTAASIRRYLRAYMTLDPYSARSADARYRVLSLYLDSPNLRLYRDTAQGIRNRYKLRLRYYEESLAGPVFFEVKKRADIIVRKSRELGTGPEANEFLLHGRCDTSEHGDDMHEFLERCRVSDARPALRIRYWREAWESRSADPVRITFDTEVEHSMLSDRGLIETRPDWQATPLRGQVILEVKFTDLRPHWLSAMLQRFELDKISVAKYAESVECVQQTGRGAVLKAALGHQPPGSDARSAG